METIEVAKRWQDATKRHPEVSSLLRGSLECLHGSARCRDFDFVGRRCPERDVCGREATGLLRVKVDGYFLSEFPVTWNETADRSMEAMLNESLAGLIVAATYLREKRDTELQREREKREVEDAHYARLEICRQEAERRRALHDRALSWRDAGLIREYVAAVKAAAATSTNATPPEIEAWAKWAHETADYLDPISGGDATALTPLRPPVPKYERWNHQEPPDTASQDARLRRAYGYPFVPY